MTKENLACCVGATAIAGGCYLLHPAAAFVWGGIFLMAVGILAQVNKARKGR